MAAYVISYDLNSPGQRYTQLTEKIKSLGSWWHCLDSTWMVSTDLTALEVANQVWSVMDPNDKLLVTPIAPGSAWAGFSGDCLTWIKNNL